MIIDSQGRNSGDRLVEYQTLLRRYLSSFIDGCFIVVSVILIPYVFGDQENTLMVRIVIAAVFLFVYEPLFTSKLCTLGQRSSRYYHLFSIIFSKDKRAIHDYASDSIVILNSEATL